MNNAARAALVLEREHLRFQKHPVWGIEAKPVSYDNMFVWKVRTKKDSCRKLRSCTLGINYMKLSSEWCERTSE